jgi:ankyrin repeat protein
MNKISPDEFFNQAFEFIKNHQNENLDKFCLQYANKDSINYAPKEHRHLIDIATLIDENCFFVLAKHGANINYQRSSRNDFGENLLLIASENNQNNIVKYLLENKVNVNSLNKVGHNALYYGILNRSILDILLEYKINLEHVVAQDCIANYLLSSMENWNNVVYLVSKGLNIDYLDYDKALKYVSGMYKNDNQGREWIKNKINIAKKYYETTLLENKLNLVVSENNKKIKL